MSEQFPQEAPPCPACSEAREAAAPFCGACGRRLAALTEPHPLAGQRRAQTAWLEFRPALSLWLLLLLTNLVLGLTIWLTDWTSPALDLSIGLADLLIVLTFCRRDAAAIGPLLRGTGLHARNWWLPLATIAVVWLVVTPYFSLVENLGADFYSYLEDFRTHGWPMWSAYLIIAVLPAVTEELAFRGLIQNRLEKVLSRAEALGLQAAMFSVIHLAPLIFLSHFAIGLALGWLRLRTGSLIPCMAMHAVWNAGIVLSEQLGSAAA